MFPSTQHEADERITRYLRRLADGSAGRKTQFFLDALASAWAPELKTCLGSTKWHVDANDDGVATVAAYVAPAWPTGIRISALSAIARGGEHAHRAANVVKQALGDGERSVRLAAARAAAEGHLGDEVARELRNVLADDVWAVRWHAARGLVARAYDSELGSLAHLLVTTTPRGGMSLTAWAQAVEALRPRCRVAGQGAELDAHVTRTFATMSARDRDFAWPLWR
ncbi:MAG: hypothetical protein JWO86_6694 [Myxococcaceae bacterium]|nr:hypothetical protein [Myxococcaceae bacterium]